jgi:hypothetical protein
MLVMEIFVFNDLLNQSWNYLGSKFLGHKVKGKYETFADNLTFTAKFYSKFIGWCKVPGLDSVDTKGALLPKPKTIKTKLS